MNENEKLEKYLTVNAANQSAAIPGKDDFTFISKITGIPQIWKLNQENELQQFTQLADRVMSVFHSPNGDKTVVGKDTDGDEKQQIYLIENDGKKVSPLVEETEYFHHIAGFSPDGKSVAFSSNRRHPAYFDLFTVNVETKELVKHYENDNNLIPIKWMPDGESILIQFPETNIDSSLYIYNLTTGNKIRIGDENVLARYHDVQFTKDGQTAYILTDINEETVYLAELDLKDSNLIKKVVHSPKWDMENLSLAPDNKKLVYTINEGGFSQFYSMDLATKQPKKLAGMNNGVIQSVSWLNEDAFVFSYITPNCPGDVWKYEFNEDRFTRLTFVSESVVEKNWLTPEICTFKSFDGLEVPYFFYKKGDTKDAPVVLYIHGGPEGQTKADYNPVIQYLADQGFAVAAPNVRGSNGYGRTYIKLDDVRKRMDSVKDLVWLVKDLVNTHGVDEKKVGIMGRSYGGFMVLAALTHFPEVWAAGVNIVGISHFKTFMENTGAWRRRLRAYEYGSLENDSDFFEEIAPLNHSEKIVAPLLVFHGRNDTRVPVSEAEQLVSDMQSRNQKVAFTVFEDEGHQTEKIENHITMNSEIVHFFKENL